jgi:spore maturation protein CgeB
LHSSIGGADDPGDFVNPRAFVAAACGAPQVIDSRELLGELFAIGEEVWVASGVDGIRAALVDLLNRPDEAAARAARARERVRAEHTYAHRAAAMLEAMESQPR